MGIGTGGLMGLTGLVGFLVPGLCQVYAGQRAVREHWQDDLGRVPNSDLSCIEGRLQTRKSLRGATVHPKPSALNSQP